MATATGNEQQQNVQRGLEYLKGSDQIIGDIVAYCVSAYKADSQPKTLERVRQYVQDTANSVSEHVLTIAHNISKMLDQETREIEQLSYETGFVAHRLQTSQSYMCELFMTKFQVYPRPRKTVHMMRKTIPEDQLPKHSRPKRWVREKAFDYTILDGISEKIPTAEKQSSKHRSGGGDSISLNHMASISTTAPPLLSQTSDPASSPITQPKVDLPTLPSTPTVPVVPAPPVMPAVPTIPSVPSVPPVPRVNSTPVPQPPVPTVPAIPAVPSQPAPPSEPPEELKPFLKMLKVGVPKSGVQSKMQAAGLDPALLDQFGDGNQPKAGGANPVSARPPNPMAAAIKARNATPVTVGPPAPPVPGGPPAPPAPPVPPAPPTTTMSVPPPVPPRPPT